MRKGGGGPGAVPGTGVGAEQGAGPGMEPGEGMGTDIVSAAGTTSGTAPGMRGWRALGIVAPLAGAACIFVLIWGLNLRLDRWDVRVFVSLIYGAAASALLWSVASFKRRGGVPLPDATQALGQFVWLGVIIAFLWVWFPPVQELVGWIMRQSSMFKFG